MTTDTSLSALDPLLTTGIRLDLLMDPPSPTLLIDGDDLIVINTVDRTDDPAVLITGNNNTFINQTGATLTGTGTSTDPFAADAAVEISGTGNSVENQIGATITGAIGVFSSAVNTSVVNDGDILGVDAGIPFAEDSVGVQVEADSSVVNRGLVRADATSDATAISTEDRATVDNSGTVEAVGRFAFGVSVGADSTVVNSGLVDVASTASGTGIGAAGPGTNVMNSGTVRAMTDAQFGNAFGIGTGFGATGSTVWNGGTVEAITSGGANAQGVFVSGGSFANEGIVRAVDNATSGSGQSIGAFLLSADGVNSGTISASSVAGTSVGLILIGDGQFSNIGDIVASGPQSFGVGTGPNTELTNSGAITAIGVETAPFGASTAVGIELQSGSIARNDGLIEALGSGAMGVDARIGSKIINAGDIVATGLDASGVVLSQDGELSNTGTVSATGPRAKGVLVTGDATIVNDGVISASSDDEIEPSVGIWFDTNENIQKTIVNSGTIIADFAIFDATANTFPFPGDDILTLDNSGSIVGGVGLGNGVDNVTNTGTIVGDVDLGAGDDVYDGRGGQVAGTIFGGDGADVFISGASADVIDGGTGPGFDALDYSHSAEGVRVDFATGTGSGGDAEGDTFRNVEKVIGSAFDDFVFGAPVGSVVELGDGNDVFDNDASQFSENLVDLGAGNDVARTGAGDDFVQGGAGRDLIKGEDGGDFLLGDEGNDLLFGGNDADQLDGGADADVLFGQDGSDALFGQAGHDVLFGGTGDDLLDGGAGNDLLLGGGGDDIFIFGPDGENDRILGFEAGAGTDDAVVLTGFDAIHSFDDVLGIASQIGEGNDDDDDDDGGVATVLTFDAETTLTFSGVRLAELNEADFIIF